MTEATNILRWCFLLWVVGCGAATPTPNDNGGEGDDTAMVPIAVGLRLTEAPADEETGTPNTRVVLVMIHPEHGRQTHAVGNLPGACTPQGQLLSDQLQAVSCWWAGSTHELSLLRRGQRLVVVDVVTEEGSEPGAAQQLLDVEIPEGRHVIGIGSE